MTTPDEDLIREARELADTKGHIGPAMTHRLADALERSKARWEELRWYVMPRPHGMDMDSTWRASVYQEVLRAMDLIEAKNQGASDE